MVKNKYKMIVIFVLLTLILFATIFEWKTTRIEQDARDLDAYLDADYEALSQQKTKNLFKPLRPKQPYLINNDPAATQPLDLSHKVVINKQNEAEEVNSSIDLEVQTGLSKAQLRQGSQKDQVATQFYKIDFYGQTLAKAASTWSCARDVKTGLLWETKLFDAGVSDVEHRFSWYNPAKPSPGVKNNGHCFGIDCDTDSYTKEINRLGLCGSTHWRLPTFAELQTLLDRDYTNPAINQAIFFNTRGASYWTSSQLAYNPEMVMQIRFFDGMSSPAPVHMNLAVRLVSE